MDELKGHIERIIFKNEENGFAVCKLKEKSKRDLTLIVGIMPDIKIGETICCEGFWKIHKKFGTQFEVKNFKTEAPSDIIGIQKYLESGLIKGIGPVYAKKIIEKFKINTLEVIDKTPERLLEIEGIGKKRVKKIKHYWQEQKHIRDVMIFLKSFDISSSFAQKIYKKYENESIKKLKENPYCLAKDISQVGFKTADKIAKKLGFENNDKRRIEAGIFFTFFEIINLGHSCFLEDEFIKKSKTILEVEENLVKEVLLKMIEEKKIIKTDIKNRSFLWPFFMYKLEKQITNRIFFIKNSFSFLRKIDPDKAIEWAEKIKNINLSKEQKEAVKKSILNKVLIITGGPGTGKSTIIKVMLAIFEKITKGIVLTAPTGRAAKRMTEITKRKAFTIHSLLEFDFKKNKFKRNLQNPLMHDIIIIDEASMIDTFLISSLLDAAKESSKIIIIGDKDQLPSVGAGNVLKDLLESNALEKIKLNHIFRQAYGSLITINAHKIKKGEFPYISKEKSKDFHFIELEETENIKNKIIDLLKEEIPKTYNFINIDDIQVLSPMKRGVIGTENLNIELQNALNPSLNPFFFLGKRFHVKDKIMQIKNNYDKNIFNGDIGKIEKIDLIEKNMVLLFNKRYITYDFNELEEIVLAYSVSVHKYQGSEHPCIVMPIHTNHFPLLFRNLLYTAVTRSKKLLFLVGTKKAIAIAVKNENPSKRLSGLKFFLEEKISLSYN